MRPKDVILFEHSRNFQEFGDITVKKIIFIQSVYLKMHSAKFHSANP